MIAHARRDERGKYSGGIPGDQDGQEVAITQWYSRPWDYVLRPQEQYRETIAVAAEQCANNNHIGYNQLKRTTLFASAKLRNWQIDKIDTDVETDCSAMVAVCVNAAGITVSKDIYTGNERAALLNTGKFTLLTDPAYLNSEDHLKRGDILLYEGHHTAVNLTDGKYTKPVIVGKPLTGTLTVTADALNVRETPYNGKVIRVVKKNDKVEVKTLSDGWFELKDGGWLSGKFVIGWLYQDSKWWYLDKNFTYPVSAIVTIDGQEYAFDKYGWMIDQKRISDSGAIIYS